MSLAATNPRLADEWHPTKNGDLTCHQVSSGSNKRVWWKCRKGDDHEWEARIDSRNRGSGCPFCANQAVSAQNSLAAKLPELAAQWHPTKNGQKTPLHFTPGSGKKVWWKCDVSDDHEWEAAIGQRSRGSGCPMCGGDRVVNSNCLATLMPELAEQWHPSKNGNLTPSDVTLKTWKKVWWKCDKGVDHEWKAWIHSRTSGNGCPICAGRMTVDSNALASVNPKLADEWHPTKNGALTTKDVTGTTERKVWWRCSENPSHEWKASVYHRSKGTNCPMCAGRITSPEMSLASLYPSIAQQWHPTRNGDLTPNDVTCGTAKKAWWICDIDSEHYWIATIVNRVNGRGCPYCTLTPQSRQELTILFELKMIFKEINPRGHKLELDGKVRSIDIFIPTLNLGIEFDGSYWHKERRAKDKQKTLDLIDAGFLILRIRQEPLKRIFPSDIISSMPFDAKKVTNDVLAYISSSCNLSPRVEKRISNYVSHPKLQNEGSLNRYIQRILEEKRGPAI